jgi:hypothetical protein
MKIVRTNKEIKEKIEELISDSSNFITDNYGSEGADNGYFEIYFSVYTTKNTLENFVNWLTNNGKKRNIRSSRK